MKSSIQGIELISGLPYYVGSGKVSEAVYPCGTLLRHLNSDAPPEAHMRVIEEASKNDFYIYFESLIKAGFTPEKQKRQEDNYFAVMALERRRVYLSYMGCRKRLSVIEDHLSVFPARELSYAAEGERSGEFFMYGLNMDPGGYNPVKDAALNTSGYVNCGMLFAIRCCDGRIIVIDGGHRNQFRCGATNELDRFLHRIADKNIDDKISIAAWFMTHSHDDHVDGFRLLLENFGHKYKLERVLCNMPSAEICPSENQEYTIRELARLIYEKYPDCMELKLHTGEQIQLADATIDVLYTHEDLVYSGERRTSVGSYNNTSTVVKITVGGMSILILGDLDKPGEKRLCAAYSEETLRSDIVQQAHHNWNYLSEIYRLANAPIACFAQTEEGTVKNEMAITNSNEVKKYSTHLYYSGDITRTVGFARREGEIKLVYKYRDYLC